MSERASFVSLNSGFLGSIRTRLAATFLVVAVVPFGLVLWLARESVFDFAERASFDRLASVVRERSRALEQFADSELRSLDAISRAPGFVRAVIGFSRAFDEAGNRFEPGYDQARRQYQAFLETYADASNSPELLLIGLDRRIVYASGGEHLVGQHLDDARWRDGALARTVERVGLLLEPEISPTEPPAPDRPSAVWAVGSILDGKIPVGYVAKELSRREIEGLIEDRWGLGRTGEVVVAAAIGATGPGDGARLLVAGPLSGDREAALRVEVEKGSPLARRLEDARIHGEGRERALGRTGRPVLAAWTYVPSFGWSLCAELDEAEAFAVIDEIRDRGALLVLGVLAGALALAYMASRRMGVPLQAASAAAARIAAGDLSKPAEVQGTGELRELLVRMRRTNDDLSALVARVQWSAGEILAVSGQVNAIADEQNGLAGSLGSSTTQIAAAINEMNATAREIRATVTELERVATRAGSAADAGRASLDRIGSSMERLDRGADEVSGRLAEIRDRATAVDEAVTVIARVANRTNLLAVNAAIEAEKAGPHGRGFHVVAGEIDRLATQTAASALDIESIVASMRTAVLHGVKEIENFAVVVSDACETASGAEEGLGSILGQVAELRASFAQVAVAIESQSEGISQVNAAMSQLVDGARRSTETAARAAASGEDLARSAASLEREVGNFRLG